MYVILPTLPIPLFGALLPAFLCVSLIKTYRRITALAILVAVCTVQSALIALVMHFEMSALRWALPVLAASIPPLAWIALLYSGLERGHRVWPHVMPPVLALFAIVVQPYALDVMIPLLFFAYGVAIFHTVSRGADTLPRLRIESGDASGRVWRWIGVALIASAFSDIAIIAAIVAGKPEWQPLIVGFGSSSMLLLMGALSLSRSVSNVPEGAGDTSDMVQVASEEDTQIIDRLDALMEQGRLYLDPDLTLTRLARRLGLPVKTLSSAINRVSGGNVSRYINARRIKAACAALEQGDSVTEAMLSAGFNTKSNFNREFLRITGKTPREFRG